MNGPTIKVAAETGVYLPRIDTLRAFAASAVIYLHFFWTEVPSSLGFIPDGVHLFFVLSGYLVTTSLNASLPGATRWQRWSAFAVRRSFRIFPAYYLNLLICFMVGLPGAAMSWPWAATYTLNFFTLWQVGDAGYLGHLWTLAVEEQFYLALPILFLFLSQRNFVAVAISCICAAAIYRLASSSNAATAQLALVNTLGQMDKLATGSLVAVAVDAYGSTQVESLLRRMLPLTLPCVILCGSTPMLPRPIALFTSTLYMIALPCSLFYAWLIVRAVRDGPSASSWGGVILPRIGAVSYGIYLFHLPMLAAVHRMEHGAFSVPARLTGIAATMAFAWMSFWLIEARLIRVGRTLSRYLGA